MSCEDCKEQVFELIEREAVDPEGVRAILAGCPDCRAEFDAMKAALALAGELPVEEPPADIDAAILRLADRRVPFSAPLPTSGVTEEAVPFTFFKKMAQVPPWAMAAVALLAVGVGVWSIPRTVQFESDADQPVLEAKDAVPIAESPGQERFGGERAPEEVLAAAMDDLADTEPVGSKGSATSPGEPARRQAPRAKKRRDALAKRSAPVAEAESRAMAPTAMPAARPAPEAAKEESVAQRSALGGAAAEDAALASDEADDMDARRAERSACKERVTAFERRLRDDEGFEPTPEEELAIGRCYQLIGQTAKARQWLKRAAADPATKRRARKALQALSRE